jgi:arsenate reductase
MPAPLPEPPLHPFIPSSTDTAMSEKNRNVLFLCTGNSARSIMAEALVTTMSGGRFQGCSAGSRRGGKVDPHAIELVENAGYPADRLRSKSWDEFAGPDAPRMDIIMVCDNAAGEVCPYWPGHPATAHWGFEDPAAVEGSDAEKRAAFNKVYAQISQRMAAFLSLPPDLLDTPAIAHELARIGAIPV